MRHINILRYSEQIMIDARQVIRFVKFLTYDPAQVVIGSGAVNTYGCLLQIC